MRTYIEKLGKEYIEGRKESCNGFHIVPTERVEDYAHILEG
jgi:hypothetical protein